MSVYAVIETGGKQYRVQPGDFIQVEKLDCAVGSSLQFDQVLLVSETGTSGEADPQVFIGKPYISGACVHTQVVGQGRGDKILIVKMKRRKQYRRTQGHRQDYTQVMITEIHRSPTQKHVLSDTEKQEKLKKFQSHLKPRVKEKAA